MERLRGLRGLVQRLGGGDSGGEVMAIGGREQTEEMLENLPLTRAFVEQLPRSIIIETAAKNDAKAIEALHLVKRVDELVESHASAARDLREYVSQISAMKTSIDKASDQAKHLHQQLLDLDTLISEAEATQETVELQELQAAEDANFETYALSRRTDLVNKKQEYTAQLASFERERISVLSEEFSSTIPSRKKSTRKAVAAMPGLESVTIVPENATRELDDFFGGGSGESSTLPPVVTSTRRKEAKVKTKVGGGRGKRPVKTNPHLGIMADEDIEDGEEVRKWY